MLEILTHFIVSFLSQAKVSRVEEWKLKSHILNQTESVIKNQILLAFLSSIYLLSDSFAADLSKMINS